MTSMLLGHLAALRPLRENQVRFRLRALTRNDAATVCGFPVLFAPSFDEVQLTGTGYRLLDRLAIDVDVITGTLRAEETDWLADHAAAPGHQVAIGRPTRIDRVILTGMRDSSLGHAECVARISSEAMQGRREAILDAAIAIVQHADELRSVDMRAVVSGLSVVLNE